MSPEARTTVVDACLAAAVLAAAASLFPVVAGPGWVVELAAALVVLTVVSVVLGRLRAPGWAVAAAQVVVLLEVLTVVHAPAQAVAGLVPGPQALSHVGTLLEQAMAVVEGQSAPIDAVPGVRLALTAAGGAALVLARAVALPWGRPALVGLPLVAVHGLGAVFAPGGLGVAPFLLAAAGWLLVVLVARPPAPRWGPVVAAPGSPAPRSTLAPLVVVGALVLALAVPAAISLPSSPTFLVGGGGNGGVTSVNPLLDLRADLTDRSDTVVLTYETDQDDPQPLRVVTVDSFDGGLWRPAERGGTQRLGSRGALDAPQGLAPGTPVEEHTLQAEVQTLRQEYLPLPYPVSEVDVEGEWDVDQATATVTGARGTRTEPGQRYSVGYQQVVPDAAALAAAPPPPPEVLSSYATAPDDLPPAIAEAAAAVTAGAGTDYDRAVALQDWLKGDDFTYTTELPPPTTESALADFLTDRRGYCVHFASAMAVMARTLGIPARVAVGFLPGRPTPDGYRVSASDAHAWPELYFEGAGWTRFEPTPSRGTVPSWTVPAVDGAEQPQAPDQGVDAAPQQSPEDAQAPAPQQDAGGTDTGAGTGTTPLTTGVVVGAAALALVLLLLAMPAAARRWRSDRRWRRAVTHDADGGAAAEAAWADLVERLGDLGVAPPVSATPRQVRAAVLARLGGEGSGPSSVAPARREPGAESSLSGLVSALERSRYGSTTTLERGRGLRHDALGVERAVRATLGRRQALLARWWPASGRATLLGAPGRWTGRTER